MTFNPAHRIISQLKLSNQLKPVKSKSSSSLNTIIISNNYLKIPGPRYLPKHMILVYLTVVFNPQKVANVARVHSLSAPHRPLRTTTAVHLFPHTSLLSPSTYIFHSFVLASSSTDHCRAFRATHKHARPQTGTEEPFGEGA
jgi:hypothetical protein